MLGWAGMAALVAMGVHGLVDVVFMVKRSLPLVGLVLGFAALLNRPPGPMTEESRVEAWDPGLGGYRSREHRGGAAADMDLLPTADGFLVCQPGRAHPRRAAS